MHLVKSKLSSLVFLFTLTILLSVSPRLVFAQVLKQITVITPTAPTTAANELNVNSSIQPDPHQEIWVTYNLLAISDQNKPQGKIVLESMPELVMTPISDTIITFNASDMSFANATSGKFKEVFEKQAGKKSVKELNEIFGPDLTKVIVALQENKGSMLTHNITRHFPAPDKNGLTLLTSIKKVEGIQPAMITITVGQGDIPAQYQKNFLGEASNPRKYIKTILGLLALFIVGLFVFQRFNK